VRVSDARRRHILRPSSSKEVFMARSSNRAVACAAPEAMSPTRRILARRLPILAGLLLALAVSAEAHDYQVVASSDTTLGPLLRTALTVRDGSDPLDRFQVTRLRLSGSLPPRGVLLLLPPAGNRFEFFEWDESGDPLRSFAAFFALRRIEVWGYSPRESGIVAGTCGVTLDCSTAAQWGAETQLDDIAFIRGLIADARPHAKVAVGGFSLGAINAVASLDAHPSDYAGAVAIDGAPWSSDPVVQAYNQPFCAALTGAVGAGVLFDEQGGVGLKLLALLAQVDPGGPSPVPGFPPGTTNAQAFVLALIVHQDVPVQPTPTYVLAAGDPLSATFSFASPARVQAGIAAAFNDVVALASLRDFTCALAGDTRYVDGLDAYQGEVLLIENGRAFGPVMEALPPLLPQADVRRIRYEAFGHLDAIMNPYHRLTAEGPIYLWLLTQVF
jgi:pimeloyl-ACP methyl ester carboxylesterase